MCLVLLQPLHTAASTARCQKVQSANSRPHLSASCPADVLPQVTGGRNGYGAKLANIFSTKFVVETADGKRGRRYKQTFTKNMSKKGEPVIT